jgi:hypothetical protein
MSYPDKTIPVTLWIFPGINDLKKLLKPLIEGAEDVGEDHVTITLAKEQFRRIKQLVKDIPRLREKSLFETLKQLTSSIQLILAIEQHPDTNPETVELCPGSRSQLHAAIKAAGGIPYEKK